MATSELVKRDRATENEIDEVANGDEFTAVLAEVQACINESLGFSMDMQTTFDLEAGWTHTSTNDWDVLIRIVTGILEKTDEDLEGWWADISIFVAGVDL